MSKLAWKPWHQVVKLRPDVRSGELSLSQFAADLYDVIMDRAPARLPRPQGVLRPDLSRRTTSASSPRTWSTASPARTTRPSGSWN